MLIRSVIALLLASLTSSFAVGGDPTSALRDFGGRMVGGTWHKTEPDNDIDHHSYRWQFADKFLLRVATGKKHLAVIGIDPASNERTEWVFQEDGTVQTSVFKSGSGDSYTIDIPEGSFAGSYGVEHKANEISIVPLNPSADSLMKAKEVWTRKPLEGSFPMLHSKAPNSIPTSLSGLNNTLGLKHIEGQMSAGQEAIGTSVGRWVLGGKFFLYAASFTMEDQSMLGHFFISGIEQETGKATLWEFGSDGSVGKATLSDDGRSITGKAVELNGSIFEFSGAFRMDGEVWRYAAVGKTKENPSLPYSWNWTDAK